MLLFINYDITIREIEKLIEIKKNNFDKFYYVKDNDNSYFSSNDGCIHMDDSFALLLSMKLDMLFIIILIVLKFQITMMKLLKEQEKIRNY